MGERRAPPEALDMLLKLMPVKNNRSNTDVCDFCKQRTDPPHVYLTCPTRPCYLCRRTGHSQVQCPFRGADGDAEAALGRLLAARGREGAPYWWRARVELGGGGGAGLQRGLLMGSRQYEAKVVGAVRKIMEKRVTALEFVPEGLEGVSGGCRRVVCGDKSGQLAIWDFGVDVAGFYGKKRKVGLETQRAQSHRCPVNAIEFGHRGSGTDMYTSSADGFVLRTPLEIFGSEGASEELLNLNPDGWTGNPKEWRMVYGMCLHGDASGEAAGCLTLGDDKGNMFSIDPRASTPAAHLFKGHRSKVQAMDANPCDGRLFASSSNDSTVKLWDVRRMGAGNELVCLDMRDDAGAITGVQWSRGTGTKLLVTTQPNRLKVWNDVHRLSAGISASGDGKGGGQGGKDGGRYPAPDLDIVHAHQCNRYLTNSTATWDPKDVREETFMCGRFLGEAFEVGDKNVLLHPVDIFSGKNGSQVAMLVDGSVRTVCVVNRFHPSEDVIVSGSSQHLYMWAQPEKENETGSNGGTTGRRRRRGDGDGDDDDDGGDARPDETDAERKARVGGAVPGTATGRRPTRRTRRS